MDTFQPNPFEPPRPLEEIDSAASNSPAGAIVRAFAGSRMYIFVLGSCLFMIGCALLLLIASFLVTAAGPRLFVSVTMIVFGIISVVFFLGAAHTFRVMFAINRFLKGPQASELIQLLRAYNSFWRYAGTLAVIAVALVALTFFTSG